MKKIYYYFFFLFSLAVAFTHATYSVFIVVISSY